MEYTRGFCKVCDKETKFERPEHKSNNVLHFFLTLITVGLWFPIWLLSLIDIGGRWTCSECGSRIVSKVAKIASKIIIVIFSIFIILFAISLFLG